MFLFLAMLKIAELCFVIAGSDGEAVVDSL